MGTKKPKKKAGVTKKPSAAMAKRPIAAKAKPRASKTSMPNALASLYPGLPSSRLPEAECIDKGSRFALERLTELAVFALQQIDRYTFGRFGFSGHWVASMNALVADLASAESKQREAIVPASETVDAVVTQAKAWRRDAMTVIAITPMLRARAKLLATGTSTPKLMAALRTLLPLVAHPHALDSGGGKVMKGQGIALLEMLKEAREAQRIALLRMPKELRELCAKKGLLYEELRRLAKTAQLVAPADAHLFSVANYMHAHHGQRFIVPAKTVAPSGSNGTSHS